MVMHISVEIEVISRYNMFRLFKTYLLWKECDYAVVEYSLSIDIFGRLYLFVLLDCKLSF